jgi:hypothetical protein
MFVASGFGTKFYALILGKHVACTYTTAASATQATAIDTSLDLRC